MVVEKVFPNAVIQGKYRIVSVLAQGAMGTVYLVEHLVFHEKMAMKINAVDDPNFRERFFNEARIMRQLQLNTGTAQNIVRVEDVGQTEDGLLFVVMEYVPGDSLAKIIARDGQRAGRPLELRRALAIASQVCNALELAHANKPSIVHRDIKPENLMLVNDKGVEVVKVLDFGIAKVGQIAGEASTIGTLDGIYMGSPNYSSPEQAGGKSTKYIDGRSDIYSLGVVFYEMLTGLVPFAAETYAETLAQHINTPPKSPDVFRTELPKSLVDLTMKALKKDPRDRFQSAAEMRTALELALKELPQPEPPKTEYIFEFLTNEGAVHYPVFIPDHANLSDVLDGILADLGNRGYRLKNYTNGPVHAICNGITLDQTTTLKQQRIAGGSSIMIRSTQVVAEEEILKWLQKVEEPEETLELTLSEIETFRKQYQHVLNENSEILQRFQTIERYCSDIRSVKETEQKKGPVVAFAQAASLRNEKPAFKAAGILRNRYREQIGNQLSQLMERYQLEEASRLLAQIKEIAHGTSEFAVHGTRLRSLLTEAERNLGKMVESAAGGDLERSRAILQTLRQRSVHLPSGFSVTEALTEIDTLGMWTQRIMELVSQKKWLEAAVTLEERSALFGIWPTFRQIILQLDRLSQLEKQLKGSGTQIGPRTESFFQDMLEVDLNWACSLDFESHNSNSLVEVGKQVLAATGQLLREVEDQRTGFEEAALQQGFVNGIKNLARHNPGEARRRLKLAVATDPTPQLKQLEAEISNV